MFSYLTCVYITEKWWFKNKSTLIWRSQEEPWQRWWGRNMASLISWAVSLYPMVSHLDGQLLALAKFCGVVMQKLPLVSDCTVVLIEVGRSPSGFLSWVMMGFWRFVIFWLKPIFDISSLPSGWNSPKKREKKGLIGRLVHKFLVQYHFLAFGAMVTEVSGGHPGSLPSPGLSQLPYV